MKPHCHRGHPYTPENTFINSAGNRVCRTCKRRRENARNGREAEWPVPEGFLDPNREFLCRLYTYGVRNGGLPNIPPVACFELLRRVA